MKIMLVGLGHEMHGDDEIGLEVLRLWSEDRAGALRGMEIRSCILESPGINLLGAIAGQDAAIMVAAIRSGAPLGTIRILKDDELEALKEAGVKKGGWGAAETLSLGRQLNPEDLPERLILVGIEGASFGLGEGLSPAVRAAIPEALRALDRVLEELAGKGRSPWEKIRGMIKQLAGICTGSRGKIS